jgi:hypothetical protein
VREGGNIVWRKVPLYKGKPHLWFSLCRLASRAVIHPFGRFLRINVSPSAEGEEGCAPSTAPLFEKSGQKLPDTLAVLFRQTVRQIKI